MDTNKDLSGMSSPEPSGPKSSTNRNELHPNIPCRKQATSRCPFPSCRLTRSHPFLLPPAEAAPRCPLPPTHLSQSTRKCRDPQEKSLSAELPPGSMVPVPATGAKGHPRCRELVEWMKNPLNFKFQSTQSEMGRMKLLKTRWGIWHIHNELTHGNPSEVLHTCIRHFHCEGVSIW